MRPPQRLTRTSTSPSSPHAADRPRPTLADVNIAPRRRLRDGSTSSRGRSSRGSSVGSSSSRGSSVKRSVNSAVEAISHRRKNSNQDPSRMPRQRRAAARAETNLIESSSSTSSSSSGDVVAISDDENDTFVPSTRDSSLSPPPTLEEQPLFQGGLSRGSRNVSRAGPVSIADFIDDLEGLEYLPPPSTPPSAPAEREHHLPFPLTAADFGRNAPSTASSSSSNSPLELTSSGQRRYTAEEKGKGRAVVPSPIEVEESSGDGDEGIQILKVAPKRKRSVSSVKDETVLEVEALSEADGLDEVSSLGGGYACPICFCPPSQAMLTQCGHIMCAQCLHSSLTAAIGRNPNPYPGQPPAYRGRGRGSAAGGRGGGRGRRGAAGRNALSVNPYGPNQWTKELLQEAWSRHLNAESDQQFLKENVPEAHWGVMKEAMLPEPDMIRVQEVLKGLWKIEDANWVVEGECPVCRNALPGGYGPPYSGIGGIIPLEVRLSGGKVKSGGKKRRR